MRKNTISGFERRFGKYAIPNLSLILILCYVAGYIIQYTNPAFLQFLRLDPYQIVHGQVWRAFTWIICPPSSLDIFTIIMLYFYYSIGTDLERTWGTYEYNIYIFGGMFITLVAALLCMGGCYLVLGEDFLTHAGDYISAVYGYDGLNVNATGAAAFFALGAVMFSTYYINMSIFLAYAATYPEHHVLLMFVVPVKVKWLGIVYGGILVLEMAQSFMMGPLGWFRVVAIAASLVNFLIFWLRSRSLSYLSPKQVKRKAAFKHQVRAGEKMSGHKCCICGRTDEQYPELEFRYCSKCAGSYEYCQDHLFTHEHKTQA